MLSRPWLWNDEPPSSLSESALVDRFHAIFSSDITPRAKHSRERFELSRHGSTAPRSDQVNVVTVAIRSSGVRAPAVLSTSTAGHLGAAVDSVLTQTMAELELIIVNDASDIETRPDPGSFGDPRVRVLRRDVNGGVAAAQNTGLRAASGEFVAFIHSDDQWLPAKLERQLDVLEGADPDCVGVESATRRVHAGSSVVWPRLAGRTHEDLLARRVKNLHLSGFLSGGNCSLSPAGSMRTSGPTRISMCSSGLRVGPPS